jgi:hypothetical protein
MLFYLFPPDYGPNTATSHCPPGVLSTPTPPHHQQHHFHPAVKAHGQSSLAFPKQLVDCCMDRFFFQNLQNFRSGFRISDCNRITMQCLLAPHRGRPVPLGLCSDNYVQVPIQSLRTLSRITFRSRLLQSRASIICVTRVYS